MAFIPGSGLKNFLQGQRDGASTSFIPVILLLTFMLMAKAPVGQWFGVVPMPALTIIVIFFWSVVDEYRLPVGILFTFGIFEDLLSGTPIGLWALLFLGMHFYVSSQRRVLARASFITNWISFGILSLVLFLILYLVVGLDAGKNPPISVLLVPYVLTLAFFPPMSRFLAMLEVRLARIGRGG